jgi:Xaa-Pro aminopeptidase
VKRLILLYLIMLGPLLGGCAPTAQPLATATAAPAIADDFQLPPLPAARPTSPEEYASRRTALAATMQDGVFVAFGSPNPDLDYLPWAQEANFRYLTGILEPEAGLVMVKAGERVEEYLFVQERDPSRELWEGARLGVEGARAVTGLTSFTSDRMVPVLDSLVARHGTLYVLAPPPTSLESGTVLTRDQQIIQRIVETHAGTRVVPVADALQELRARKSPTELDYIRRAVQITTLAHREAMKSLRPGMNEFEIQGLIEYTFRRHGAERPAFLSIVGSGPNTTTLHYRSADRVMNDGELLLMDVGASYRGYAADVTRTAPVSGEFSADQRAVYEIVLEAQKAAEQQVRAGRSWTDANAAASLVIATGLARLGLIDAPNATYGCSSPQTGNRCPQFLLYYMHALGHGVGLEVHDPDASYFGAFEVGSAFTLEPGIYVREDVLSYLTDTAENQAMVRRLRPAVARYAGIGVRIEDVYIVTEAGADRVSQGVPREVDEIETLMREPGLGQLLRRGDIVDWYPATSPQ